jgi:phage shock protein A
MADLALRDAIAAVKNKISSAAADATPEELAYLGTAIDRIGGRATVLEIEQMGDTIKAEISVLVSQTKTDVSTNLIDITNTQIGVLESRVNESRNAIDDKTELMTIYVDTKLAETRTNLDNKVLECNNDVTTKVVESTTVIESVVDTAEAQVTTMVDTAVTKLSEASAELSSAAAAAKQQSVSGSLFTNYFLATMG